MQLVQVWISNTFEFLLRSWQGATPYDYGQLILAIAVCGWLLSRRQAT